MNNKIIFCFIILLALFSTISLTSANENVTCDNLSIIEDDMPIPLGINDTCNVNKSSTDISADNKTSYTDYSDEFKVTLTSNGSSLANKSIVVNLNNVVYNKTTDSYGQIVINFKLTTGIYNVSYSFEGDENYTSSNGTATITVYPELVTYLDVVDKDINYRQGLKSLFQLKLVDVYGNPVSSKNITIKVGGKTYIAKTDSKGIATFSLSLKKGTYVIQCCSCGNGIYLNASGTFKIFVKSKLSKGHGYWVDKWSMKKVKLKKLAKLGTKHIFLLHTVFSKYGKGTVLKWIKKAHKYGMKVHIWMAVFYKNGKFIHPVSKKGVYNYKFMNTMIKKAKYYAGLKGVDGIQFDYIRFGGNAYKYKNAVNAVNYFIKKASVSVRSINSECVMSAAVMPEPSCMKHYYAQDVPTMSKYLDVVVPMVYKGNYHAGSKWIKKTTKKFVKQSNGAKIWSGILTYKSDSNIKKLSYKALFKDAKNAMNGGASGVVLFRWGLTKFINFKKL
ncbi:putative glycoside hydrolase [Methanobrevibacter sp. V74]|uniref:putative glycoside hydrolase n=1 Tax=Methanobrevibacter sp. V74 TaxID=3064279 RepID=UPI0027326519|nr:putative glycoside hydrolase [Methanobrevibacter sp. V74]